MILHFVLILLFGQQCIRGEDIDNISIESVLDQVAIPTKIIEDFLQKPSKYSSTKKYVTNDRLESSTVHYENSNGFVPLVPASQQRYDLKQNHRDEVEKVENPKNGTFDRKINTTNEDASFPSEARIFMNLPAPEQNRRSFNENENRDEFELLKVNNNTPAVANYGAYYDNTKQSFKSDHSRPDENSKKTLRNKNRERGKRIQSHVESYDETRDATGQYSHPERVEEKKNVYRQENYEQETPKNYRSEKSSLPQTNYATVTSSKSKSHSSTKGENEQYRFKSPIMVEPSKYKIDVQVNGQSIQAAVSTSTPHIDTNNQLKLLQSEKAEPEKFLQHEETSRAYDYADSRDFSDENPDYPDEIEKSHRVQKPSRRRPYHFDSSRKLPKEHRESYDDSYDDQGRKRTKSKSRYRPSAKPVQIINEDDQYNEEDNFDDNRSNQNNQDNSWTQVAPNIEVSHSNGFEVNQIEKPKLHIVPVNILSNFDHATALDNSQGFDISNAMFTGFVHDGVFSTASPLMSSSQSYIDQNLLQSSSSKTQKSSVPDVIVGQSSFNNPVQAVLMPNKLQQSLLNQYMQSTVSPAVFAVTPSPSYPSSTVSPHLQQLLNQAQATLSLNQQLKATPFRVNSDNGQRQNTNFYQHVQSTTSRPRSDRDDSRHKKKFNNHNNNNDDGQFLASASLSVDQDIHRHSSKKNNNNANSYKKNNRNNYHNNNNNNNYNEDENSSSQSNQQTTNQNFNTFVQPTMIPAILHTGISLINGQNQFVPSSILITNPQQNSQVYQTNVDNVGGASTNVNAINNLINPLQKAQLPILGAKNVEIVNPNLNGNGNVNAYAINQIPAALVTTPIPIFTTTGFIASKQFSTTADPSGADRTMYNPINFVPNYDLMKSQSILNTNVFSNNDQFSQQNLNLVPLLPGGNFYKHTQGAQINLASKPKLTSDLEKYAEEMFKESLRTIYNSHKWNNDPRSPANVSLVDDSELAKLRNELLRIKSNIRDSKIPKEVLEAHHTETRYRTAKPGSDYKRPDSSAEHSHKNQHKAHPKPHHHAHHHRPKPELSEILTPPKPNSFVSKSPFHDKPPKKRPAHGPRLNFNHETSRPRPRQGVVALKPVGPETQASSIIDYRYPIRPYQEKPHYGVPDFRRIQSYNNYPTFTTSFPQNDQFKSSVEYQSSEKDYRNLNNQRTHNLMGLLMKNKQLPPGTRGNFYTDKDTINKYFDEENRRTQSQAYEDVLRSFQPNSDNQVRNPQLNRFVKTA